MRSELVWFDSTIIIIDISTIIILVTMYYSQYVGL